MSMPIRFSRFAAVLLAAQAFAPIAIAAPSAQERTLEELRNTVVNLLQALVERGVVTREQAQAMVQNAQTKAAAEAAGAAEQDKLEADAVRVPYVPEIVKEEIRKQVAAELAPEVTKNVVAQAKSESWGVPAALPDWVKRLRWGGDVRVRAQGDQFSEDNLPLSYTDVMAVNEAGGVVEAGVASFLNTTEDRQRMRARLRLALDAELGAGWTVGTRLTTGNLRDPVSTNQTLGNTGARYQSGFDLAYIKWQGQTSTGRNTVIASGGRLPNPWYSTDLVWDQDLTFEGVATTYRFGLTGQSPQSRFVYLTAGAFPLQEIELASDKWFYGGQLGLDWTFAQGSRLRFGLAYYDYKNITGEQNTLDSNLLDYTAPQFVQRGNSLFDIRRTTDNRGNLFALAADYTLVNATFGFDWKLTDAYRLGMVVDVVENIAFDEEEILARTGRVYPSRTRGYQAEINFGSTTLARQGAWRGFFGYRYLEADAVLDAFTDSDFHLGGTDAKGFFIGADYSITERVLARLRYLSANEIDGLPLGIDVLQLDLTTQF